MNLFTYLYVLVSKPGDTYYEQALVSAISLRRHMPSANIVLLVDDKTEKTLFGKRAEIRRYVSDVKSVEVPDNFSNLQKSRWLKTKMPEFIQNDFLYIDSDTVVADSLKEIETIDVKLGAVLDRHLLLSDHSCKSMILENAARLGFQATVDDKHFNGGLLLVRRCEENVRFFETWHSLWLDSVKKGLSIDQIALAQTNYLSGGILQELPGIWNCQVEYSTKYLSRAKILHMFVTDGKFNNRRPHIFMDSDTFKDIEKNGLSDYVMEVVEKPLQFFKLKTQVIGGDAVDFYNTALCRAFCQLYCSSKTRRIFNFFEHWTRKFLSLSKKKKIAF